MINRCLLVLALVFLVGCEKQPSLGKYSIGRDPSWFPLQLDQQFFPNITAFTTVLVQKISKVEEVPLTVIDLSWAQLFQSLEEEEVAGIFTSLPPTPITTDKYTFSDPFLWLGPVLVVKKGAPVTSLLDLEGKIVGVNQFSESVLIVQEYPSILIKLYENMPTALEDLVEGKIDGVLLETLEAHALIPNLYPDSLKIVTAPLNDKGLRLITLKGKNEALIRHFNAGLKKLRHSSNYADIRETYGLK